MPPPPPGNQPPNAYFSTILNLNNPQSPQMSHPDPDLGSEPYFNPPMIFADAAPPHPSPRAGRNAPGNHGSGYGGGEGEGDFNLTKRGLQARGKDYSGGRERDGREWEARQKRDEAVRVLEGGEELVLWVANARNESIPQTRAHYRNIILGLDNIAKHSIAWHDEWDMPADLRAAMRAKEQEEVMGVPSPARSTKGKEREIASMRKKRVSSGQGHS